MAKKIGPTIATIIEPTLATTIANAQATKKGINPKQIKAACGSGGTVKDGTIEVQGDHCDKVVEWLKKQGHTVKRAGG